MNYYNLEALKSQPELYQSVSSLEEFNKGELFWDKIFLSSIFGMYKLSNDWESFSSVLKLFYENYNGDKKEWLRHTLSIVYVFADLLTNVYLSAQLSKVVNSRNPTQKEVLLKLMPHLIRREASLNDELEKISHQYGWSIKSLRTTFYKLMKD